MPKQNITYSFPKGRNCRKCKYNVYALDGFGRLHRYCGLTKEPAHYPEMIQCCNLFILDRKNWIDIHTKAVVIDG